MSPRPRRAQTPRPERHSLDLTDSESSGEDDVDPTHHRYPEPPIPTRAGYTPAPAHLGMPSITTRTPTPSVRLRPESRQQSSQGSSGLTYASDNPVIPPPPPGFIPYPGQDPVHRQNPFPTPRAPFQQSPLHPAPVPPPPQLQHHRNRSSDESQWG
jgi:hypothetical protein